MNVLKNRIWRELGAVFFALFLALYRLINKERPRIVVNVSGRHLAIGLSAILLAMYLPMVIELPLPPELDGKRLVHEGEISGCEFSVKGRSGQNKTSFSFYIEGEVYPFSVVVDSRNKKNLRYICDSKDIVRAVSIARRTILNPSIKFRVMDFEVVEKARGR